MKRQTNDKIDKTTHSRRTSVHLNSSGTPAICFLKAEVLEKTTKNVSSHVENGNGIHLFRKFGTVCLFFGLEAKTCVCFSDDLASITQTQLYLCRKLKKSRLHLIGSEQVYAICMLYVSVN